MPINSILSRMDIQINSFPSSLIESFVLDGPNEGDQLICPICNQSFTLLRILRRHLHSHGLQVYTCQTCNLDFRYITEYKKHMSSHNQDKKPCNVCGKRFSSDVNLDKHYLQHMADGYTCKECDFKCDNLQSLKNHKKIHSVIDRPYACEICGQCFREKSALIKHFLIHTNYRPHKCDLCPASFRGKGDLTAHYRQHTGEQPFECIVCNKRFRRKYYLTRHTMLHTGEKPYVCDLCGQAYSRRDRLVLHRLIHSKEKDKVDLRNSKLQLYNAKDGSKSDSMFHPLLGKNSEGTEVEFEFIKTETVNAGSIFQNDCREINVTSSNNTVSVCAPMIYKEDIFKTNWEETDSDINNNSNITSEKITENKSVSELNDAGINFQSTQFYSSKNICEESQVLKNSIVSEKLSNAFNRENINHSHILKDNKDISIHNNKSFSDGNLDGTLPLDLSNKRLKCNFCEKRFTSKKYFCNHLKKHLDERSYFCFLCNKQFAANCSLIAHLRIHTKEKPFDCGMCGKHFRTLQSCNRHIEQLICQKYSIRQYFLADGKC